MWADTGPVVVSWGVGMDDARQIGQAADTAAAKISARGVQVYYGQNHALKDVDVEILDRAVTAFIGPSGCANPPSCAV